MLLDRRGINGQAPPSLTAALCSLDTLLLCVQTFKIRAPVYYAPSEKPAAFRSWKLGVRVQQHYLENERTVVKLMLAISKVQ